MTHSEDSPIALRDLSNCDTAHFGMQRALDNPNALLKPHPVWLLSGDLSDAVNRLPHSHGNADGSLLVRDKAVGRREVTYFVPSKRYRSCRHDNQNEGT